MSAIRTSLYLEVIIMRLVSQPTAVEREGGEVPLSIGHHHHPLAGQRQLLRRAHALARRQRAQDLAERRVDQHGAVWERGWGNQKWDCRVVDLSTEQCVWRRETQI